MNEDENKAAFEGADGRAEPPPTRYDAAVQESLVMGRWLARGVAGGLDRYGREPYSILVEPFVFEQEFTLDSFARAISSDVQSRYVSMKGPSPRIVYGMRHGLNKLFAPAGSSGGDEAPDSVEDRFSEMMAECRIRSTDAEGELADAFLKLGVDMAQVETFFTLGERETSAVYRAFIALHERGLAYRDRNIIRWCKSCRTALSESEVDSVERDARFWFVRYPIAGSVERFVTVATAFPETIPADCALMVSEDDPRTADLKGRKVIRPIGGGEIPVIGGRPAQYKGSTGIRRVTPGERKADFDLARSMGLDVLPLFNAEGLLAEGSGRFRGMDRQRARESAIAELEEAKLLDRAETHRMEEEACVRCARPVMPLVSEQWFVRMRKLAAAVTAALDAGEISVRPLRFETELRSWAENVQDWCISRQNLFGQRIPVNYCLRCGAPDLRADDALSCAACGNRYMRREQDVIDPFFAACVAPLCTAGWPESATPASGPAFSLIAVERRNFLSWAARTLAVGHELTGACVCRKVLVMGQASLEAGEAGQKTSLISSTGIAGSDALRMALARIPRTGNDERVGQEALKECSQLANKVWNSCRFLFIHGKPARKQPAEGAAIEDSWILGRVSRAAAAATAAMERMEHDVALESVADFFMNDLCAWYIEMVKPARGQTMDGANLQALSQVVYSSLRLLHPFAPFLTEASARLLSGVDGPWQAAGADLRAAPWPQQRYPEDPMVEARMGAVMEVVRAVRSVRSSRRLGVASLHSLHVSFFERVRLEAVSGREALLSRLLNATSLVLGVNLTRPPSCISEVFPDFQVYVSEHGCPNAEREQSVLRRKMARLQDALVNSSRKLESWEFLRRAPSSVVEAQIARREKILAQIEQLRDNLEELARQP